MDGTLVVLAVLGLALTFACVLGICYCLGMVLRGFWDAIFTRPPQVDPRAVHQLPRPRVAGDTRSTSARTEGMTPTRRL